MRDKDDEGTWDEDPLLPDKKDPLLPDNDCTKYWLDSVEIKYIGIEQQPLPEEDDEEQVVDEVVSQPENVARDDGKKISQWKQTNLQSFTLL
jgi:hypothetical protein